jgi:hypothetical protein
MKKQTKIFIGGITFLLILFTSSMRSMAQEILFAEPFDDPAMPGWEHSGNTFIEENHLAIRGEGFAMHGGFWSEATYSLRFQRQGQGGMAFHYQVSEQGSYVLFMGAENIQLSVGQQGRQTEMAGLPFEISPGEWHQLEIRTFENTHIISLDGQTLLEANILDKLPAGGILLRCAGELIGLFDDLHVQPTANLTDEDIPEGDEPDAPELLLRLPLAELKWNRLGGPPGGLVMTSATNLTTRRSGMSPMPMPGSISAGIMD